MRPLPNFDKIWVVDFEYMSRPGEIPAPVCAVGKELNSGIEKRIWLVNEQINCPFDTDEQSLYVAFYNTAEFGCHLALNWPLPENTIDLFVEYRVRTNGIPGVSRSLLRACSSFGITTITDAQKDNMRDRILRGPPYTNQDKQNILDYCATDVEATTALFQIMLPQIDLPRALYRGKYMTAVAVMEHNGTPLDVWTLNRLKTNWDRIQTELIQEVDKDFGVYEGRTFKKKKFEEYLIKHDMSWPRTDKGNLELSDDTFKKMADTHPEISPLRDLRYILGAMRLSDLPTGADGRNRCMLSPYKSSTGRNQPSSNKFIFGPAVWVRGLIKPEPGAVLAYIDYSQEEFYIAAVLSGDKTMQEAYETGDPYLSFAKLSGAVPETGTKETHKTERNLFKQCVLGVQYGMGAPGLSLRINSTPAHASELLRHHKRAFKQYWTWLDQVFYSTILGRKITTCYGWTRHINGGFDLERSIKNFPMQATGAEVLRVACILLSEAGIKICASVHDAILIECAKTTADKEIKLAQDLMKQASTHVLGKPIRTEAKIVQYPDRYMDHRGVDTWNRIMEILAKIERAGNVGECAICV